MPYPTNKPTGNYSLREYNFAENDTKKVPMDEYLFKNGYKNADESELESVPDAHNQNWLFDVLHRNLKYTLATAEENKSLLASKVATPTSIGQIKVGYGLEVTSSGVLSVVKDVAQDANIISYDLPVGSYMLWAGSNTPEYFIEPKGQTLLRSSYPDLWEFAQTNNLVASGNSYTSGKLFGNGDGSTTFVVFDIRGQFIKIANDDVGKQENAGLPNITGSFPTATYGGSITGAFYFDTATQVRPDGGSKNQPNVKFDASRSNSIYGKSNTVTPQNISLKLILKALPTPPSNAVPTGTILDYTGNTAPDGYIIANGAELSRTQFSKLYNWVISNGLMREQSSIPATAHGFYGTGDGSTTFTIPDLRGVFKRNADLASNRGGSSLGEYQADGLPDHNHTLTAQSNAGSSWGTNKPGWGNDDAWRNQYSTATTSNASDSNLIYGNATQVQPKSVSVIPILKY